MQLNQITIAMTDVAQSIEFYQKLGLILIVKSLPKYARFECTNSDMTFSLHQTAEKPSNNTWIYFETENLDQEVQKLINKGITFESMPTDQPWLWREDGSKIWMVIY